jgi:hypothetical protein
LIAEVNMIAAIKKGISAIQKGINDIQKNIIGEK